VADRRRFSWWTDDDGMVTIQIRMEAEPGAQFLASIESLAERDARRERAARKRAVADGTQPAEPGCEETRIERLHAHHLRHWLYGGRTDVSNMVLLCDVDHGLAHDEELIMSRRGRELVVHDRRGRRIWAPAEESPLATVTPLRSRGTASGDLTDLLPADRTLPGALPSDGERMDLQFAVWALIAHRDVVRRRAA
jgi:hypothetical protein